MNRGTRETRGKVPRPPRIPRLLTTGEVARLLGVDPATVIRRGNDGTLSYRQIGPRGRRRYHPAELLRLGVPKLAIDAALTEEHGKHGK